MADESPEQIRERVLAEELEKGSDPRVAEGRSKAAEARAREGLPIDPAEAWKAKLEKEGGAPATQAPSAEAAPAPTPEEPTEPAEEKAPEPSERAEPAAAEAEEKPAAAAPAAPAAEAPMPEGVQRESDAPAELARVTVAPPAVVEPPKPTEFEPEIGELVEFETEEMGELAGIKMADAPLPSWLVATFVSLVAIAAIYLLVFSGAGVSEQASGCRVAEDRTIVCSPPAEDTE